MNLKVREELNAKMACLADGDRSSFDFVYEISWPLVHRFALKTIGAVADAEDVAQHALLKVFSRAPEFRQGSEALPWMLGITAYECKTHFQKVRRRREDIQGEEILNQQSHPSLTAEEQLYKNAVERAVRDILGELRPQDQEVVLASIGESERPELPPATYRKRLSRALARLREKWSDET